jgi:hypothetical protein
MGEGDSIEKGAGGSTRKLRMCRCQRGCWLNGTAKPNPGISSLPTFAFQWGVDEMEVGWGFVVSVTTVKSVQFGFCRQFVVDFAKTRGCRRGHRGLGLGRKAQEMPKWQQHRASRPEGSPWSWRSAPTSDASARGSPPGVAGTGARMSSGLRGRRGFASGRRLRSGLG